MLQIRGQGLISRMAIMCNSDDPSPEAVATLCAATGASQHDSKPEHRGPTHFADSITYGNLPQQGTIQYEDQNRYVSSWVSSPKSQVSALVHVYGLDASILSPWEVKFASIGRPADPQRICVTVSGSVVVPCFPL